MLILVLLIAHLIVVSVRNGSGISENLPQHDKLRNIGGFISNHYFESYKEFLRRGHYKGTELHSVSGR